MDIQKFTQKSIEAIQKAQNLAIEHENSQIDQEHLLYALLIGDNSLIKELLKKIDGKIGNIEYNKPILSITLFFRLSTCFVSWLTIL